MNYMIEKGIPSEKMSAVGYGEERPIADNSTSEGRRANRRVEIHAEN
jgi:OOP family OmpA-OmpF porin